MAPFQSPIQVNSTCIEQNISIQENLNVAVSIKNDCDFQHSNRKHMASGFPEETLQIVLSVSISSKFFFFSFFCCCCCCCCCCCQTFLVKLKLSVNIYKCRLKCLETKFTFACWYQRLNRYLKYKCLCDFKEKLVLRHIYWQNKKKDKKGFVSSIFNNLSNIYMYKK